MHQSRLHAVCCVQHCQHYVRVRGFWVGLSVAQLASFLILQSVCSLSVMSSNAGPGPTQTSAPAVNAFVLMVLNVSMTVFIVVTVKTLYMVFQLTFVPTLLLTVQQGTCALLAYLSSRRPDVPTKEVPGCILAYVVITQVMAVVTANLSLKFNSLGTYQLLKMLNIPFVFLGEWHCFAKVPTCHFHAHNVDRM